MTNGLRCARPAGLTSGRVAIGTSVCQCRGVSPLATAPGKASGHAQLKRIVVPRCRRRIGHHLGSDGRLTATSSASGVRRSTTTPPPQSWPPKLAPPGAGMPPEITYGHRRAGPRGEPTTVDYVTSPVWEATDLLGSRAPS